MNDPKFQYSKMFGAGEQIVVRSDDPKEWLVNIEKALLVVSKDPKDALEFIAGELEEAVMKVEAKIAKEAKPDAIDQALNPPPGQNFVDHDEPEEVTCQVHNKVMPKRISKKGVAFWSHSKPLTKDASGKVTAWDACFGKGYVSDQEKKVV